MTRYELPGDGGFPRVKRVLVIRTFSFVVVPTLGLIGWDRWVIRRCQVFLIHGVTILSEG